MICEITHSCARHDSCVCVTYGFGYVTFAKELYERDYILEKRPINLRRLVIVATPYVTRDTFICVTRHSHVCDMTHPCVPHDSFICVTWLIHRCHATHPYVRHDSSISETWLIHMCDMTGAHSHVWHVTWWNMFAAWLIYLCDMTYAYVRHDSCPLICVTQLNHELTWLNHICGMPGALS